MLPSRKSKSRIRFAKAGQLLQNELEEADLDAQFDVFDADEQRGNCSRKIRVESSEVKELSRYLGEN
jgi:hypothetical protein